MSLDSTGNLKQQLINNLGPKYPIYLEALQNFSTGKISRTEFEDTVNQVLTTTTLREWLQSLPSPVSLIPSRLSPDPQCTNHIPVRCHCSVQKECCSCSRGLPKP